MVKPSVCIRELRVRFSPGPLFYKFMFDRKEYIKKYQREWIAKRRQEWFNSAGPCVQCGTMENRQLDHIDPKTKIHHAIWSWAKERRDKELTKCQVLCKNCHLEKSKKDISNLLTGTSLPSQQVITKEQLITVLELIKNGFSERKACKEVGINRGTFTSLKHRGYINKRIS